MIVLKTNNALSIVLSSRFRSRNAQDVFRGRPTAPLRRAHHPLLDHAMVHDAATETGLSFAED